ncbi:actin binding protein [Polyrhizophydium stewartii]|uniref:Actin binding protein n=1 Tax=Polyrhizophydium stewartii TaxID=2732419 RepID=A0ABR4MXJ3_9FUNG
MTQVSFSAHSGEIASAYKRILSESDPLNWAILSYSGGTNDLKLFGSGDGGLEELKDEFEEGKIQYAFARVVEPISGLPKFVLIAWCGDGVPVAKKGLFHHHVNDVVKYFKGFHVQINARADVDVEPDVIMKKVKDSSGAKYSVQQDVERPSVSQPPPVSSAPKPLYSSTPSAPASSISPRSSYGSAGAPSYAPTKPVYGAAAASGSTKPAVPATTSTASATRPSYGGPNSYTPNLPPKQPPATRPKFGGYGGYAQVESRPAASAPTLASALPASGSVAARAAAFAAAPQRDAGAQAERERREREERERVEREERDYRERQQREEQQRADSARAQLDSAERERQESERRVQLERQERERRDAEERAKREHMERQRLEAEARLQRELEVQRAQHEPAAPPAAPAAPLADAGAGLRAVALYEYTPDEANEIPLAEEEIVTDIVQVDEGWWEGTNSHGQRGLFPANYVEIIADAPAAHAVPEPAVAHSVPSAPSAPEPVAEAAHPAPASSAPSQSATALFDYAAAEPNELTFSAGDVITNIVFVSEDWWQGTVHGVDGLFPGNYVELIQ